MEGVIMHGFAEIDGVQHLDLVWLIHDFAVFVLHRLAVLDQLGRTPLEHFAALHQDGALLVLSIRNKKKVSCF